MKNRAAKQAPISTIADVIKHYFKHHVWIFAIAAVTIVLIVLIIFIFPYISGSKTFPPIKIVFFHWFGIESGAPPGPEEPRYAFDFDGQPLAWAVEYLNKMVPEVNIILSHDVASGTVPTKRFSLHLKDANLEEILNAFCVNAATTTPLRWRRDGKNIFIELPSPSL
jgi:hypothetical protein